MITTASQQKFLRSKAHRLKPIVWIGQNGLTDSVRAELETALDHHELIKVKLHIDDRELRNEMVKDICETTHSTKIQGIGSIVSIYRGNEQEPVLELPK